VVAGPAEATALGNLLVQMVASGEIGTLQEAGRLAAETAPLASYVPRDAEAWEAAYARFSAIAQAR